MKNLLTKYLMEQAADGFLDVVFTLVPPMKDSEMKELLRVLCFITEENARYFVEVERRKHAEEMAAAQRKYGLLLDERVAGAVEYSIARMMERVQKPSIQ